MVASRAVCSAHSPRSEVRCPCASCCSTGATCTTPRPAARRSTSSPSPRGWRPAATTSRSAPRPIPAPCRRRPWPACATCAAVGTTRSTRGRSARNAARERTTSSSTCRTACRTCHPLVTRSPVVNLVHHVHREQWPVVFGPRTARFGWWLESQAGAPGLPPHQLRRRQRLHDARAGRPRRRPPSGSTIIHNGTDAVADDGRRALTPAARRRPRPAGAAEAGRDRAATPWRRCASGCRGCTWTSSGPAGGSRSCARASAALGLEHDVTFHGHVSEAEKHRLLAQVVGARHAEPEGGLGPGRGRGRGARHADRRVPQRGRAGRLDRRRRDRAARRRGRGRARGGGVRTDVGVVAHRRRPPGADEPRCRRWVSRFRWEDCIEAWEQLLVREAGR